MEPQFSMPHTPWDGEGFESSNLSIRSQRRDSLRRISLEDVVPKKDMRRYSHVKDLLKVQKYLGNE